MTKKEWLKTYNMSSDELAEIGEDFSDVQWNLMHEAVDILEECGSPEAQKLLEEYEKEYTEKADTGSEWDVIAIDEWLLEVATLFEDTKNEVKAETDVTKYVDHIEYDLDAETGKFWAYVITKDGGTYEKTFDSWNDEIGYDEVSDSEQAKLLSKIFYEEGWTLEDIIKIKYPDIEMPDIPTEANVKACEYTDWKKEHEDELEENYSEYKDSLEGEDIEVEPFEEFAKRSYEHQKSNKVKSNIAYEVGDILEKDGEYYATILNIGNETIQLANDESEKDYDVWRVLPGDLEEELESGILTIKNNINAGVDNTKFVKELKEYYDDMDWEVSEADLIELWEDVVDVFESEDMIVTDYNFDGSTGDLPQYDTVFMNFGLKDKDGLKYRVDVNIMPSSSSGSGVWYEIQEYNELEAKK